MHKNPNSSVAANNLAFYYAEYDPMDEHLAKAERLILPLLGRFKDNPDVVDTAAWIYYRKGDLARARDLLLAVEEKIGNRHIASYHLGMIYLGLGQEAKARKYLQAAIKGKEEFPGRKEAERTLKDLT